MLKWLRLNKLSLNAGKTELIFFHSKSNKNLNFDNVFINFAGIRLSPVDFIKYLGMYIDKYLDWTPHVRELSKKLSRANGILSKLRYNMTQEVCIQVYYALFYSNLIYGCNAWGLTSEENIKSIEVLQRKCIRILTFAKFDSHIPNETFVNLKLLKVRDVIKFFQLKLIYDFQCTTLPTDLMTLFKLSSEIRTNTPQALNSIDQKLLYIPKFHTVRHGKCSLRYHGPKLWNETFKSGTIQVNQDRKKDIKVSKIKTVFNFKNAIKRHYLFNYSNSVMWLLVLLRIKSLRNTFLYSSFFFSFFIWSMHKLFSVLWLNFYVGAVFLLSASVFQWYSNVPRVPLFSFFSFV